MNAKVLRVLEYDKVIHMLDLGASGLYGPAMNIHRTAYSGRNFEYYSEDPFLSGKIAAAEVEGIQSKGVYVYVKHFALNDTETKCRCIATFASEQAIRELYLKSFEMAITEGGAKCVMNSFARIGGIWSGAHKGLQTNILRGEWGLPGFNLTDFSGNAVFATYGIYMKSFDVAQGLLAAMYGPVAGALIGFIGHALIDLSWGGIPWWSWVIASAFTGVVVGLFAKKLNVQEGDFNKRKVATFAIANVVAHAIAWIAVAPVLDILIYAEPANKVFAQGAFAAVSNIITAVVVGGLLILAYTKTIAKKGSLDKE